MFSAIHVLIVSEISVPLQAKQVMELLGSSYSTFGDMVNELGLSAAMTPGSEFTLLAPLNAVFTGESHTAHICASVFCSAGG